MTDWQESSDPGKFPTEEFRLQIGANERLVTGAIWRPKELRSDCIVAFGHGASGDRYQAPIPYIVHRLIRQGFACVSMDGPVHGLREKAGGGRAALGQEMQRNELVDETLEDWQASIDAAADRLQIDVKHFAYFGLSMGSIFGIPMLADRIRRGLNVSHATLGLLGTTGAVSAMAARLLNDASEINVPVLFLMQLEDELFPRDGYLQLFDALSSETKHLHANPGLHPEIPGIEVRQTIEFLSQNFESS